MYCTESMTSSVAGRKGARRQEVEVRHNLCLMSSSPWKLHKSMKERVRERLRTTERHRWLGKDEGWGVVALSTLNAMRLMSSYLFLVILPFFLSAPHSIWAFWNEQKYAINYLHQKFNICGSFWLASSFTLEQCALPNRYSLRLGHYCQLVMF